MQQDTNITAETKEIATSTDFYCSCVRAVQEVLPDAPLIDAADYPRNALPETGDVIILKYTKENGEVLYHVAAYQIVEGGYLLYNEGNYDACAKTTDRIIPKDDSHIVGFFSTKVYKKFKELPQSAQDTLMCESGGSMYNPGILSVIRGKAGEWGIGQFMPDTWEDFQNRRREQGIPGLLDKLNPIDQLEMVDWAWQNDLQSHWSCYAMVGG